MGKLVIKLKKVLQEASQPAPKLPPPNYDLVQSKVTLQSLGLDLGDKVVVGGLKVSPQHIFSIMSLNNLVFL